MQNPLLPELLAEFFGTLVLILFGNSVIAMVVLFGSGVPGEVVHGGRTNITIDFPRRKVLPYSASQTAGAFFAAAIIFAEYRPAFLKVDPTLDHTASVFTTFPAFPGTPFAGFLDQTIGTRRVTWPAALDSHRRIQEQRQRHYCFAGR